MNRARRRRGLHGPLTDAVLSLLWGQVMFTWLVWGSSSSSSAGEPNLNVSARTQDVTISINEIPEPSMSPASREVARDLLITIHRGGRDGSSAQFIHRQAIRRIDRIEFCPAEKALVIGELPFGGDCITVLDTKGGKVDDIIRAYGYSLSPSKRYLAYKTWYARLGPAELRKSIVLAYDVASTAADNRVPGTTEISYQNAGIPIFPEANAKFRRGDPNSPEPPEQSKAYNVNLDGEYYVMSPFCWSSDETQLVFFVFDAGGQHNYLVRTYLQLGIGHPIVRRAAVDVGDFIRWDVVTDTTRKGLSEKTYKFAVESLAWINGDAITVRPHRQYWLRDEITLPLP